MSWTDRQKDNGHGRGTKESSDQQAKPAARLSDAQQEIGKWVGTRMCGQPVSPLV